MKVTLDFDRVSLYEALADLKQKCGVDIVVAAEVAAHFADYPENSEITRLKLDVEVASSQALDLITQLKGLAYVIEEPRVVIVPRDVTRDPSKPVIDPATMQVAPKLTVVGRVIDASGVAVPGAKIVRYPGSDEPVATADVAGRFELKIGRPYGSLEAHAPGQVPSLTVSVTGEPGAQVTIELATRGAGGDVTVHVVNAADGTPLRGAVVYVGAPQDVKSKLADGRDALDRSRLRFTDEKGVASVEGVAPGRVAVTAKIRGYAESADAVEVVTGKVADVTVRLAVKVPLVERLKTLRVSFNFRDARPAEIVRFLNDAKQLNIVIDSAAAVALENRSVSLTVNEVTVTEALDTLCREIGGLEYVIEPKSEVVFIRTPKK